MKRNIKKLSTCLLAFAMSLSLSQYLKVNAADEAESVEATVCEYVEAVEGHDCEHVHDDDCGFVAAVEEVLCDCTDTDDEGLIVHTDDCTYQPAVEGQSCTHVHDDCGYIQSVKGNDCEIENKDDEGKLDDLDNELIDEAMMVDPLLNMQQDLLMLPLGNGSITIENTVEGTDLPDNDTVFTFTVTTNGIPAVGTYTIDEGEPNAIPEDGVIQLKAGQNAVLSGLAMGVYTIEENMPEEDAYRKTSFTINGGKPVDGLSATVILSEERPMMFSLNSNEGGWLRDQKGNLMKNTDGYFVYTITESQIDEFGEIDIDCNELAYEIIVAMETYGGSKLKIKIVNETNNDVYYSDYDFTTVNTIPVGDVFIPDMANLELTNLPYGKSNIVKGLGQVWLPYYEGLKNDEVIGMALDVIGFDGEYIRMAPAPLRSMNPAIISYFMSNPHSGELIDSKVTISEVANITLLQMNAFPELIKEEFTFKDYKGEELHLEADADRTYADFICAFYRVNSLDELSRAQVYNVLGTGFAASPNMPYKGQAAINNFYKSNDKINVEMLNDGTLDYFKAWGMSSTYTNDNQYPYGPTYFILETDPEILKLGYEYLYERGMRLTFDNKDWEVNYQNDNTLNPAEDVAGLKNYLDKNQLANEHMRRVMNNGQAIAAGESIDISNGKSAIELPNAWNGGDRSLDFGFSLKFIAETKEETSGESATVSFKNIYGEEELETGLIKVSKTVSGNGASTTERFNFTVRLSDETINGTYGEMEFNDGVAEFTLSHGESKQAELPEGISFTVEEDAKDYSAKVNGHSTNIYENSVSKDGLIEANYNNYKAGSSYEPDEPDHPHVKPDDPKEPEVPVEIPEEDVPLGPGEEVEDEAIVDILEPDVPLSDGKDNELDIPKTKDSSYFWLTSFIISGAALITLCLMNKKKSLRK